MTDLLPSELARYEEVCRFGQDRLEPLARTIAAAFVDDPIWQWMYGEPGRLDPTHTVPMARAFVSDTSPIDEIHGFRHHDAVALWRAPLDQVTEAHLEWKQARSRAHWGEVAAQIGEHRERLREFGEAARAARPDEPHWYLQIIGVSPGRQGEGLGARVMTPMLQRCDRLGMLAYVESSNPQNHAFHRRLGFEADGTVTAAGSPPMTRFLRAPR